MGNTLPHGLEDPILMPLNLLNICFFIVSVLKLSSQFSLDHLLDGIVDLDFLEVRFLLVLLKLGMLKPIVFGLH